MQPHLQKCFHAVAKLEFGTCLLTEQKSAEQLEGDEGKGEEEELEDTSIVASQIEKAEDVLAFDIIAMISPEGEKVGLVKVSRR